MKKTKEATIKKGINVPKWMDCTWRRKACGLRECPVCGKIKKDRENHVARGEDPDDIKFILEDVIKCLKDAISLIKKDADRLGIEITNIQEFEQEPPEMEEFPLCGETLKWHQFIFSVAQKSKAVPWTMTEDAQDLFWYANTICAKTYRQFYNKWQLENEDEFGEEDYAYTGYVLQECFKIVEQSLKKLIGVGAEDSMKLMLIYSETLALKDKILKI